MAIPKGGAEFIAWRKKALEEVIFIHIPALFSKNEVVCCLVVCSFQNVDKMRKSVCTHERE